MDDVHISLPKPCSKRWEDMAPGDRSRQCVACDKTIHDLAALTLDETEALLENDGEVCVRARIGSGGRVALADSGRTSRHIKAVIAASLGLAVAACQTTGVTPLYTLSGMADGGVLVFLNGTDGRQIATRTDRRGHFRIANLRAGTYELTTYASCGGQELTVPGIQITSDDIDIGTIEGGDGGCIVVGLMERSDPGGIG